MNCVKVGRVEISTAKSTNTIGQLGAGRLRPLIHKCRIEVQEKERKKKKKNLLLSIIKLLFHFFVFVFFLNYL